jgi:hypothetical protein
VLQDKCVEEAECLLHFVCNAERPLLKRANFLLSVLAGYFKHDMTKIMSKGNIFDRLKRSYAAQKAKKQQNNCTLRLIDLEDIVTLWHAVFDTYKADNLFKMRILSMLNICHDNTSQLIKVFKHLTMKLSTPSLAPFGSIPASQMVNYLESMSDEKITISQFVQLLNPVLVQTAAV